MIKFYPVEFRKFGKHCETVICIGTLEQVKSWCEKESYAYAIDFYIAFGTEQIESVEYKLKNVANY